MMKMDDRDPPKPRLRGLDPDLLLGVLEDDVMDSPPELPGWRITGVAGSGGSGIVWRAMRACDGVEAAIKIASPGDPETVERIEREAQFLRELRHPHVVALLDAGPISGGPEEGGLFLAMEFIDGSSLAQEIPESGLAPDLAIRWFRQIAEAVAHAHDHGILHRDLKPGNVLVAPDGNLKVADFGLARPVHRRVHQLSLTRAGLVAGTAEYLPPEAYRRDYAPTAAGDVFALGVILHEMLTGAPPRGAWKPASHRVGVDVRMDAIISRAMDADPDQRWSGPRAMLRALDDVMCSAPRFSGTPMVTLPVRVADALWSVLGVFVLMAGTSSLMRLNQSLISLPLDLVGRHGDLTGGFQALSLLLLAALPLSVWQMLRLRWFRGVPMREALPSPFGLPLGHRRLAAVLVCAAQLAFLWIPAMQCVTLYLDSGLNWLKPGDPPWVRGLAVTGMDDREILNPWSFGHGTCWLWDSFGPPAHGLAKTVDRISFIPFLTPAMMLFSALLLAAALYLTVASASIRWWRWHRKTRSMAVLACLAGSTVLAGIAWSRERDHVHSRRDPRSDPFVSSSHMTSRARQHAEWLLTGGEPAAPGDPFAIYQDHVDFRGHGMVPRQSIAALLEEARTRASAVAVEITRIHQSWDPESGRFTVRARAVETFDRQASTDESGADDLLLELEGIVAPDGLTVVSRESLARVPMFRCEPRPIRKEELDNWVDALSACARMTAEHPRQAEGGFVNLFHPVPGVLPNDGDSSWMRWLPDWNGVLSGLFGVELKRSGGLDVEFIGYRTGGISGIRIPFHDMSTGHRRDLTLDLVLLPDGWRCVRLAF
jgi:hypothetical protein